MFAQGQRVGMMQPGFKETQKIGIRPENTRIRIVFRGLLASGCLAAEGSHLIRFEEGLGVMFRRT